MNCDCIAKYEKALLEKLQVSSPYKKPVKRLEITGVTFAVTDRNVTLRSCSKVEIELDGQKKLEHSNFIHNFCPFCGIKQEEKS